MKSGYTLIEILIVLVIIGLLFTAGYANFRNYARQQALTGAARALQLDLRTTQEYANAGNKPSSCDSTNLLNGYQFNVTSNSTYEIDAVCTQGNVQIKQITLPAGITISTPNPNPIIYKSLAQGTNIVTGTSASIILSQQATGNRKTVTIGANGN